MNKQEEQQVKADAFTELATILLDHGEQHALSNLARLMEVIDSITARAEAAEAALAAAPVGAMKLVVWMLDGGPWDDVALAEVQRWIDAREESQP